MVDPALGLAVGYNNFVSGMIIFQEFLANRICSLHRHRLSFSSPRLLARLLNTGGITSRLKF